MIDHVSVRTSFSVGESLLDVESAVSKAKEFGYKSICLADRMTIANLVDFHRACDKHDIKPISGVILNIVDDPSEKVRGGYFIKAYINNEKGLKDLFEMLTLANQDDHVYYKPRLSLEEVVSFVNRGNLTISTGDFNSLFIRDDYMKIIDSIRLNIDDSKLFIDICPINTPLFDRLNYRAIKAIKEYDLNPLITYPVLYKDSKQSDSLGLIDCIAMNKNTSYMNRSYVTDFCFSDKSQLLIKTKEMKFRIEDRWEKDYCSDVLRDGIKNIRTFVDAFSYKWEKQEVSLPKIVDDEHGELSLLVKEGFKRRIIDGNVFGYKVPKDKYPYYVERLKYEMGVLNKLGFENYFILVERLIRWSRDNNVMVGCGRGSIGGSLVAFCLNITDIDPLRFGLIFERFINPSRQDLPDADLDFMSSKRHLVVEHIHDEYGDENVAGISNFNTMGLASSLRETARIFGVPGFDYACTKYIPDDAKSLDEAADRESSIYAFKDKYPDVWDHANNIVGAVRTLGRHAAGVIISGEPIVNRAVIERRKDGGTTCWDKRTVEDQGLVKMDILGLATLDLLDIAKQKIKKRHGVTVDYESVSLEDEKVLDAFSKGDAIGIFQFESCLSGDSVVDGMTIKERYEKQTVGDSVRTLNEIDESITYCNIGKIVHSGRKTVYNVKLKNGKMIKATSDHKFYVNGKWMKLESLSVGDKLLSVK